MKIVFICGSLEPGRDGVGDYTRRIACELIRQGHATAAISFKDKHIDSKFIGIQESDNINLPVLRLPSIWNTRNRINSAKEYIDKFDPEWLSLQFVIFGFNAKGLPIGIGAELATIGYGRRWHIMFHELWVQVQRRFSIKYYIWERTQRHLIKSLITVLKPRIIHTHTRLYQHQLNLLGFNVGYLPLFGNIPRIYKNFDLHTIQPKKMQNAVNFVIFGHIHPDTPLQAFTKEASKYAFEKNVEIKLTIIGRCGNEQEKWIREWEGAGMGVSVQGERSPEYISKIFETTSIGISTTPMAQIEKSGSVAAMREHTIPVICVSNYWQPKNFRSPHLPEGIFVYKSGNLKTILASDLTFYTANDVGVISKQFLNSLDKDS
ncbi:MAG: hypothetical protein ACHQF4_10380 [Sphingobacteriales bacterium]